MNTIKYVLIFLSFFLVTPLIHGNEKNVLEKHIIADSLLVVAREAQSARDYQLAEKKYLEAIELYESSGALFDVGTAYFHLARLYYGDYKDSLALQINHKALLIFQSLDSTRQQAVTYNRLGQYLSGMGMNVDAIQAYEQAAEIHYSRKDSLSAGQCLNNIGLVYYDLGEYQKSLQYLYEALDLKENYGANDQGISSTLLNIGTVLDALEKPEDALLFYKRTIEYKSRSGDSIGIARVFANMAIINKNLNNYEEAIFLIEKSNEILERYPDDELLYTNLSNLGNTLKKQNYLKEAIIELEKALELALKINNKNWIGDSYRNIGGVYFEMGEYNKSISLNLKSLDLVAYTESYGQLMEIYKNLAKGYAAIKNFNLAYKNSLLALQFRDSVYRIEQIKTTEELQTKYETEKKEQQIELQEIRLGEQKARLQRNSLFIGSLVVVVLLLVIIAALIWSRAKKKQELIRQEVSLKLREAEINAVINSQEKERSRFARDLHDGFGQMISVLKMNLSRLNEGMTKNANNDTSIFNQNEMVIEDMYAELRNICFDLMPQTLLQKGLSFTLKELGEYISQTGKINCEVLIFDDDQRLPELQEISLFRVVQEWINNILKHADADNITIQLTKDLKETTVTIEDNGAGFNPDAFYNGKGNGWKNIQSRLKQINGVFDLDTKMGIRGNFVSINIVHSNV